jgi:hypothetical protein
MNNNTPKTKNKDFGIYDIKTGELVPDVVVQLAVQQRAHLYPGYFTSFHQDRHLIKALSPGAYRLNGYLRAYLQKGNWITVTQKTLMKELNLCNRVIIAYMAELQRLDVIRGRYGKYMYNPRIAINGGSKALAKAVHDYHSAFWVAKGDP